MKYTGERFIVGQALGDIEVEHFQRYETVAPLVRGRKVLDAACGSGYGSFILSAEASEVTGIDISEQAVAYAREKYVRDGLRYVCASIESLPLPDASVDVVVSFETIEHVTSELQHRFMGEIRRVLRPDGMLIMSSPDKRTYSDVPGYDNPYHVHEMYLDEFRELLAEQFSEVKLFHQGIDFQRLGILQPLEASQDAQDGAPRLLGQLQAHPDEMRYFLAVCSNVPLEASLSRQLFSLMPCDDFSLSRLYPDFGEGFDEKRAVSGRMTTVDGTTTIRFEVPQGDGLRALRFDPLEGGGCDCRVLSVRSNVGDCDARALNAFSSLPDGGNRFLTMDPQYGIVGDLSGITWLEIVCVLHRLSIAACCQLSYAAYEDSERYHRREAELRRTMAGSLFFDCGQGFREGAVVRQAIIPTEAGEFSTLFTIHSDEPVLAVRFDPDEGHLHGVCLEEVLVNGTPQQFCAVNAAGGADGYDFFLTMDPQYVLDCRQLQLRELTVSIRGQLRQKYECDLGSLLERAVLRPLPGESADWRTRMGFAVLAKPARR